MKCLVQMVNIITNLELKLNEEHLFIKYEHGSFSAQFSRVVRASCKLRRSDLQGAHVSLSNVFFNLSCVAEQSSHRESSSLSAHRARYLVH